MTLENVNVKDASELLGIYSYYVENTCISFEITTPALDEFSKRIQSISSKYPYIKAVENGEIFGYAYANCFKVREAYKYCVETTVYVKNGFQKRGIGKLLYGELEKRLKENGIKKAYACVTAEKDGNGILHSNSIDFHKRMGYTVCGEFADCGYKFGKWHSMVYMQKSLDK